MKRLALTILLLLLASPGWAATYWVSTAGSDASGCTASTSPLTSTAKRTLDNAWNCLAAGDTLMVRAGTYAGLFLNNGRGGTSGSPKTLRPATGETVMLDAALTSHSGQGVISFWGSNTGHVTIDGSGGTLKITDSVMGPPDHASLQPTTWPCQNLWTNVNGECNGLTPATDSGANMACAQQIYNFIIARRRGIDFDWIGSEASVPHHIRVLNVEITRMGQFATWGPVNDLEVSNSHIHNNDLYGSYVIGFRHVWRNNHVHHNRSVGLRFGHDGSPGDPVIGKVVNGVMEGNLIHDNFGRIFHVSGSAGASDLDSGGYGFICYGCSNNLITNNVIYNNAWNDRWGNSCNNWGLMVMDRLTGANQVLNNTIVGHNPQSASSGPGFLNFPFGAQNTIVRNNILYQNKDNVEPGTNTVFSNNLCNNADTGCTIPNSNPQFISAVTGDFRLQVGSPAINVGMTLANVPTDLLGIVRPQGAAFDVGAYEFSGAPQPDSPPTAQYTFDNTTADATGHGHTGTLVGGATFTAPGIVGTHALQLPTVGDYVTVPSSAALRTQQWCIAGWINMTATDTGGCVWGGVGGQFGGYLRADGTATCYINAATGVELSTGINVLTGTNRHLACTYDGTTLRASVDGMPSGQTTSPQTFTYGGTEQLFIGQYPPGGPYHCKGRIDQVYVYPSACSPEAIANLYSEQVPGPGMSVAHMAWYAANTAQGAQLGSTDTDRSHPLTTPIGVRWAIHKADPGSLTEYFRPYARVLSSTGAVLVDWTEITNSFGTLGVRYLQDTAISQGEATSVLLPLDGFTGIAGKILENPIDTTAPYADNQRITIGQGQHAEEEIRVEFGPPRKPGERVEIRPQRENGSPFDSYGDKIFALQFPGVDVLLPQNFSPVIDAVSCLGAVTTDIRGVVRPQGTDCDIGAYEMPTPGVVAGRQGGTYAGGTLR